MASITLAGNPINTVGNLPQRGTKAPAFKLTKADLSDVSLSAFAGKKKVLSIVPSLDTDVCALSATKFNAKAQGRSDVVVLNISCDLPFAARKFCESNNVENVMTLSLMRDASFGTDYGVRIQDGPLAGVLSRAIVVLDENDVVIHSEQVSDITHEPNYDAVWKVLG